MRYFALLYLPRFTASLAVGALALASLSITAPEAHSQAPAQARLAYLPGTTSTLTRSVESPRGVAVDVSGNVYIADYAKNRVYKIDSNGEMTDVAIAGLVRPTAVAVDAESNLYVADQGGAGNSSRLLLVQVERGTVSLINSGGSAGSIKPLAIAANAGHLATTEGASGAAEYDSAAVDLAGHEYFARSASGSIVQRQVSAAGSRDIVVFQSAAMQIAGFTLDAAGSLYIADRRANAVWIVPSSGGQFGAPYQAVNFPDRGAVQAIAADANGSLYLTFGTTSADSSVVKIDRTHQTVDFGTVPANQNAVSPEITLMNVGNEQLSESGAYVSEKEFSVLSSSCGAAPHTLKPGESCGLQFGLNADAGTYSDVAHINNNSASSSEGVFLHGITAATASGVYLSTAGTHNFGTVYTNGKMSYTVTVTNSTGAAFPFALTLSGASDFTQTNTCGSSIANGGSCSITFSYVAGSSAVYPAGSPKSNIESASWTIANHGYTFFAKNNASPANSGTLLAIAVNTLNIILNANYHDFGVVPVGSTSAQFGYNIYNGNTSAISFNYTYSGNLEFDLLSTTCTSPIPAHGQCSFVLTFNPSNTGRSTLVAQITVGGGVGVSPSPTVTLTGTGGGTTGFTTSTGGHNFLGQVPNTTSSDVYGITLSNTNGYPVTLSFPGTSFDTTDFGVQSGTDSCGTVLASGAHCNIAFLFHPAQKGFVSTTYPISGKNSTGTAVPLYLAGSTTAVTGIALKGTGSTGSVTLNGGGGLTTTPDFGVVPFGNTTTQTKAFQVNFNSGNTDTTTLTASFLGNPPNFSATLTGCQFTSGYNQNCLVTVNFIPPTTLSGLSQSYSGTLQFYSSNPNYTFNGSSSITFTAGDAKVYTTAPYPSYNFGSTRQGVNGNALSFTIVNPSHLNGAGVTTPVVLSDYNDWAPSGSCSGYLADSSSCSETLTFHGSYPAGAKSGTYSIGSATGVQVWTADGSKVYPGLSMTGTSQ